MYVKPVTPTESPIIFPSSVPYIHTTVFVTTPESEVIDPTDTHSDTKFKSRLQKFIIRIPPNIAQTHHRMAPIKLSIGRAEKKRRPLPLPATNAPSNTLNSGSNQIAASTDSEELNTSPGATIGATNPNSGHIGGSTGGSENSRNTEDLSVETGATAAIGTREGFTVSGSLFAKVKRVLHQKQFVARGSKGSNGEASTVVQERGGGEEVIVIGGPDGDSDTGSSSSGNSGSDGNSSTTNNTSATSNDSSSTVADPDDGSSRLRQRKYSFGSRLNIVDPARSTLELSSSPTTVTSIPGLTTGIEVTILEEIIQANDLIVQDVEAKELAQEDQQTQQEEDEAVDPVPLFQEVLRRQHQTEAQIVESLQCLRQLILAYGIPDD
ncbi:hypothetical protein BGZ81_002841, partial [Podila clonocystis]